MVVRKLSLLLFNDKLVRLFLKDLSEFCDYFELNWCKENEGGNGNLYFRLFKYDLVSLFAFGSPEP